MTCHDAAWLLLVDDTTLVLHQQQKGIEDLRRVSDRTPISQKNPFREVQNEGIEFIEMLRVMDISSLANL